MRVSRRKVVASHRCRQRTQRICLGSRSWREARLRALCVTRTMLAQAGNIGGPHRGILAWARGRGDRNAHDADAAAPRYAGVGRAVRAALCHGRAGVRQRAAQQTAGSFYAARPHESERPVAGLLPGAQHRKLTHAGYAACITGRERCARSRRTRVSGESLRDTSHQRRIEKRRAVFARCGAFTTGASRLSYSPNARVFCNGSQKNAASDCREQGGHPQSRWQRRRKVRRWCHGHRGTPPV